MGKLALTESWLVRVGLVGMLVGGMCVGSVGLVTEAQAAERQTIFFDDFESGSLSDWESEGDLWKIVGDGRDGYGKKMGAGGGSESEYQPHMTKWMSAEGYESIIVSFDYRVMGFDQGDFLDVYFYPHYRTGWYPLAQFTENTDGWHHAEFAVTLEADNQQKIGVHFFNGSDAKEDKAYIDNVLVTGVPLPGSGENQNDDDGQGDVVEDEAGQDQGPGESVEGDDGEQEEAADDQWQDPSDHNSDDELVDDESDLGADDPAGESSNDADDQPVEVVEGEPEGVNSGDSDESGRVLSVDDGAKLGGGRQLASDGLEGLAGGRLLPLTGGESEHGVYWGLASLGLGGLSLGGRKLAQRWLRQL